ncbi:hypothetical protein TNCV_2098741 [Trichonephila clavipes]|nr:hypothetical protein TNCV_2098741 [Trichonephila clavipes]
MQCFWTDASPTISGIPKGENPGESLVRSPTSKDTGLTLPAEGLFNISRYPGHLPDIACYYVLRQSSQPEPRRSQRGLRKQDSFRTRGRSLGRRGQASVPANLPNHLIQSIALDMLYPMHFTHLR